MRHSSYATLLQDLSLSLNPIDSPAMPNSRSPELVETPPYLHASAQRSDFELMDGGARVLLHRVLADGIYGIY